MPFIPTELYDAYCPYCINGYVKYDRLSKKLYCCICNKFIKCEGL
uniref:Uncharacterized protein n=1 Tax=viral metagenome TaxID=1070528 RepID=A0A6C0EPD4_9ZZZZ